MIESATSFRPLVASFARREMQSRYKRSVLGWFWSFLNPLATIVIYSLVFGVFLRTEPPETSNGQTELFAIYLFIGLIVWNLFAAVVNGSMDWLLSVMDLRKKVYFPTETAILGGAMATGVQTLFEMAVLLTLMVALGSISWTFVLLVPILLAVAMFALGIGFFVAALNSRYRDVRHLLGIVLSFQFFLVPIVYPLALLSRPDIDTYGLPAREFVTWNPVSLYVQAAHDAVYFNRVPDPAHAAMLLVYSVVMLVSGLWYFRRKSMDISEEL